MIVVLEGGDQAGKLTQSLMLEKALGEKKIKTKLFNFPDYETPTGKKIREYLDGKREFNAQEFHHLQADNRLEKLDDIELAMQKNSVVIMNRYSHSNIAYGMANGLEPKWVKKLEDRLPKADLVILLDISSEESFQRQRADRDVFEKNKKFLGKVLECYRNMAHDAHWKKVDATKPKEKVHAEILDILLKAIKEEKPTP